MSSSFVIFFIIAIIAVIYVLKGFKIVPQSETRVVERLGRYDRTLQSGINYLFPIIDQAREVIQRDEIKYADGSKSVIMRTTSRIDLREQVYDFDKQSVITKDNVTTTINALLYFQIVDPVKSVYEIDNLPNAIEKLTQSRIRFVAAVAKRYVNNNLSMDELIKAGNKGLVQAAEKFDENRGFKFICYAIWWIRQSIENEISNSNNLQ